MDSANTEAFLRFHRFHERFSRSIKLQAMGLSLLADEAGSGKAPQAIYEHLNLRGWLWGGMPDWTDPMLSIENARMESSQGGIVRAFSAFDVFSTDLIADLCRWRQSRAQGALPVEVEGDADEEGYRDEAKALYRIFGGSSGEMATFLRPFYRYFRTARNCIAHRDAIASAGLARDLADPRIATGLARWTKVTNEMNAPDLGAITEGKPIAFTHRQAIAASSILRLIAWDISQQAVRALGSSGMVYLAARRLFWEDEPLIDTSACSTGKAAIAKLLTDRYRVNDFEKHEIERTLRELGLTRSVSDRFAKRKKKTSPLPWKAPSNWRFEYEVGQVGTSANRAGRMAIPDGQTDHVVVGFAHACFREIARGRWRTGMRLHWRHVLRLRAVSAHPSSSSMDV